MTRRTRLKVVHSIDLGGCVSPQCCFLNSRSKPKHFSRSKSTRIKIYWSPPPVRPRIIYWCSSLLPTPSSPFSPLSLSRFSAVTHTSATSGWTNAPRFTPRSERFLRSHLWSFLAFVLWTKHLTMTATGQGLRSFCATPSKP